MPRRDGQLIQGGLDCTYNICSGTSSFYTDDLDEVREVARDSGVRFVHKGGTHDMYIPGHDEGGAVGQIGGTLMTRYSDESLDLFHLFRDEEDFAGFLPVTEDELLIALDALKAFREPAPMVPHAEYGHLHPKVQALYRGVFNPERGHQDFYLRDPDEVAA